MRFTELQCIIKIQNEFSSQSRCQCNAWHINYSRLVSLFENLAHISIAHLKHSNHWPNTVANTKKNAGSDFTEKLNKQYRMTSVRSVAMMYWMFFHIETRIFYRCISMLFFAKKSENSFINVYVLNNVCWCRYINIVVSFGTCHRTTK